MMIRYFIAFLHSNKMKSTLLYSILAIYFSLIIISATLHGAIPEIAQLPLQSIGVQTIVQKTGEIPEQMIGAIFPHSNAPISQEQFDHLAKLPFVEEADRGLFYWYFDHLFFKAVLGLDPDTGIIMNILRNNIDRGTFNLGKGRIIITSSFHSKNDLSVGETLTLGDTVFTISAILQPNVSGNIIPADIYMSQSEAMKVVRDSAEIEKIYDLGTGNFSNVVLLRASPDWIGDKEELIKKEDKKFLVFSEKTFTKEITDQLGIISSAGRLLFIVMGIILAIAFGLLTIFNIKSREQEIAILRMIGWRIVDLKKQFISENLIVLTIAIFVGSCLSLLGISLLGKQSISMELPWDISALPHFLPEENSIERVVSAELPIYFEPQLLLITTAGFILFMLAIMLLTFRKIKKIRPYY